MATPLQIISINSLERAILYQTYTRDSIVVVQQERKISHRKASPLNDLDPGSREFDEWVTKNHMMYPIICYIKLVSSYKAENRSTRVVV